MNLETNIADLITIGETAEAYFLGPLGYTTAAFDRVSINSEGKPEWEFELFDDFQKDLTSDLRVNHSYVHRIGYWTLQEADATLLEYIEKMPNRAQRELQVLAKKMGSIDADMSLLVSAQAKAFVERLKPSIDELRRQLTDQS